MPAPLPAVAAHAALVGAGGTAPACGAGPGMSTVALEGAAPGRALGVTVDFIGTPGADKPAAGRVTEAALGAIALPAAAGAASGRASGAPALVVAVVELAGAAVAGAAGAAAGAVDDVTVAVIEWAGAANAMSARTSKLRFMSTPFIVAAATMRDLMCQVLPFRR